MEAEARNLQDLCPDVLGYILGLSGTSVGPARLACKVSSLRGMKAAWAVRAGARHARAPTHARMQHAHTHACPPRPCARPPPPAAWSGCAWTWAHCIGTPPPSWRPPGAGAHARPLAPCPCMRHVTARGSITQPMRGGACHAACGRGGCAHARVGLRRFPPLAVPRVSPLCLCHDHTCSAHATMCAPAQVPEAH